MDQQAAIRDMMQSMRSGKATEVQDKFNNIMQARASEALDSYKAELAKSVFKNPDLEAMGLADGEEHITQADPAAGPETVETGDENENV